VEPPHRGGLAEDYADDADREDAEDVAEDRDREGTGEQHPSPAACFPVEVRVCRRPRGQREKRADAAARVGDIQDEHVVRRVPAEDVRPVAQDIKVKPVEDTDRHACGKRPQVGDERFEMARDGEGEHEVPRREQHQPSRATAPQRVGDRPDEADQRDLLEEDQAVPRTGPRQRDERGGPCASPRRRQARGLAELFPVQPDVEQADKREKPCGRHILERVMEGGDRPGEHRPIMKPPREKQQNDNAPPQPMKCFNPANSRDYRHTCRVNHQIYGGGRAGSILSHVFPGGGSGRSPYFPSGGL